MGENVIYLDMASEEVLAAIEKQKAKKPIGDLHSVPHFRCPICNRSVKAYEDSIPFKYCPDCGQKLDWGEENAV